MHLKFLHFAEYAAVTQENKLIVAGLVDNFNLSRAAGAPPGSVLGPLPPVYLVAVVECSIGEGTVHTAKLKIVDDDAKDVAELDLGQWNFFVNQYGRPMRFQAVIHLNGIVLPRPGDYPFKLLVDGQEVGETPLYVTDVTDGRPPA